MIITISISDIIEMILVGIVGICGIIQFIILWKNGAFKK